MATNVKDYLERGGKHGRRGARASWQCGTAVAGERSAAEGRRAGARGEELKVAVEAGSGRGQHQGLGAAGALPSCLLLRLVLCCRYCLLLIAR